MLKHDSVNAADTMGEQDSGDSFDLNNQAGEGGPGSAADGSARPSSPVLSETLEDASGAETIHLEPVDGPASAAGGEFDLLMGKLKTWSAEQSWQGILQLSVGPLKLLFTAISLLVVLQLSIGLVQTLNSVPLLGGLLELTGLIRMGLFARDNLLRQRDRTALWVRLRELRASVLG